MYVPVNYYMYDGTQGEQIGSGVWILPQITQQLATGAIISNGTPTDLLNTWNAAIADFQAAGCKQILTNRSQPDNYPTTLFESTFPSCKVIREISSRRFALENKKNGYFIIQTSATDTSFRLYLNKDAYESGAQFLGYFDAGPAVSTGGSGSTLGSTSIYLYNTIDGSTGKITKISRAVIEGVASGRQSLTISRLFYNETTNASLRDFLGVPDETAPSSDPYGELDGESEITGGGTGTVNVPGFPGLTSISTGIIGLFAPSAAQMQALASFMWTDFGGQGTTTEDILKEIVEALKRSISNPLDYVIGLNIIPSQGLSIGESAVIRFGFISSGVSMPRLSNQYFTVDCGSLDFDPICGDTFLDYAPYSKFSIYLPYIGVKEVDANDFVGHTIGVVYHGDTVTGGVTAYITKDGSVMYQYSGCCALNIPLSSDNWGNTISGAVQIATSIVGAAASGGAAGIAQAAVSGVASVAANPSMLSPQVAHSGAVSGGAGCMAVQYPFVIREAVRFHSTEYFNTLAGYPAFYYRSLAEVSGYTKVLEIHLQGMTATQEEVAEIETILKQGAIF